MKNLAKEFEKIKDQYDLDDSIREKVITLSRDIIRPSKQAIYALHRNDSGEAEKLLKKAKDNIIKSQDLLKDWKSNGIGALKAGLEEYAEAKTYYAFTTTKTIPSISELDIEVHYETYLAALCDFSGELIRKAVLAGTNKEKSTIKEIHDLMHEMFELFLKFDFRSGELRKKFDSLKYHLARIEDIAYDMNKW